VYLKVIGSEKIKRRSLRSKLNIKINIDMLIVV
jgi:hypothetical protein